MSAVAERAMIKKSDIKDVRPGEIELLDGSVLLEGDYEIEDAEGPLLTITPFLSSAFERIEYRKDVKELKLFWRRGHTTTYSDVPVWAALLLAFHKSPGGAYNEFIKGHFPIKGTDAVKS